MKHFPIFILALLLSVAVSAQNSAHFTPINATVKPYKGKPAIFLNGEPIAPQFYALTDVPTGNMADMPVAERCIKSFAEAGFKLYQMDLNFNDMYFEDGTLDLTYALRQLRGVINKCPDGAVMFRLHCNPPFWWLKQHPEEWVRFADVETQPLAFQPATDRYLENDLKPEARNSFASEKWLNLMGAVLKQFCTELAKHPEADHLMGIQIANGLFGENHYWAFVNHDPDVSEPMQKFFRNWLKEKYKDDATLQKAWHNSKVTLATARVPGIERHNTSAGIFRDPQKEQQMADYIECQHKSVTRSINYFAKIVKENWPREILVGTFYGYYFSLFGRQAAGGHLLEQDVLTSPYIDFMCAPQAYNKNRRAMGGPGISRGLVESVTANGKVWLDEMDQPTHYGVWKLGGLTVYPKEQSIQINRKFVFEPFVRGGGLWYYDFGNHFNAGWWDDPDYMADITKIRKVFDTYFHRQYSSPADVLLVFDTKVFFLTATQHENDPIADQTSVNITAVEAFKTGASVNTCYLSDLPKMNLAQYKAIVFVNCFYLTKEEKTFIRKNVARECRNLVWCTAPGYTDGKTLNTKFVSEATGIKMGDYVSSTIPDLKFNKLFDNMIQEGKRIAQVGKTIFLQTESNVKSARQTFFTVTDSKAVTVATYDNTDKVAAAYKKNGNATDWFIGLPPMTNRLLKKIFVACGCHIYNEADDSTLCGAGLIVVHTKDGGQRTITLKNGKQVKLNLEPSHTVVLDAETGEVVME